MPVKKRQESFMVKPKTGWLHDDRALNAGRGIYVKYPSKFIGTIELNTSVRSLTEDQQTTLAVASIKCVCEADAPRVIDLKTQKYTLGNDSTGLLPCMLCISSKGILIAPEGYEGGEDDAVGIIDFKEMRLVSLAAGGEDNYFDYVVYIAKDSKTGKREAFVFDCEERTDEVLKTLGQAFNLAIQESEARKAARAARKNKPKPTKKTPPPPKMESFAEEEETAHVVDYDTGNYTPTDEAFALPAQVEAIYDQGNSPEQVYDIANPDVAAIVKDEKGQVDDVAEELLKLMKSESCAIYESTEEFKRNPLSPVGLIEKLNEQEESLYDIAKLNAARTKPVPRPSWVYFKQATVPKKANWDELRAKAAAEQN